MLCAIRRPTVKSTWSIWHFVGAWQCLLGCRLLSQFGCWCSLCGRLHYGIKEVQFKFIYTTPIALSNSIVSWYFTARSVQESQGQGKTPLWISGYPIFNEHIRLLSIPVKMTCSSALFSTEVTEVYNIKRLASGLLPPRQTPGKESVRSYFYSQTLTLTQIFVNVSFNLYQVVYSWFWVTQDTAVLYFCRQG